MKTTHIGNNGFGRIGRTLLRLLTTYPQLNVVAINDLANAEQLIKAYMTKRIAILEEPVLHLNRLYLLQQERQKH